jgi:nucleoside-diphosphate-sugar epimerase
VRKLANPDIQITIAQQTDITQPKQLYVPSVERARDELGLRRWISLEKTIDKTLRWANNIGRESSG